MSDITESIKKHIANVSIYASRLARMIEKRGKEHDISKLGTEEFDKWVQFTPELKKFTYGTKEYQDVLDTMKELTAIHHANNRHHVQHFKEQGIKGMNLVDLTEMICDWKAASERSNGGNIRESLEKCQKQFNYSDDVKQLLLNTVILLEEENAKRN
jgi:hypothetical protein